MSGVLASMWMPDGNAMRLVLPELLLLGAVIVLLLAPMMLGRKPRLSGTIALLGTVLAAIGAFATFPLVDAGAQELFAVTAPAGAAQPASGAGSGPSMSASPGADGSAERSGSRENGVTAAEASEGAGNETALAVVAPGMLVADRLSMWFRVFLMAFLVAIIGMWFLFDAESERYGAEFFTLLLCSAIGMALMASTINLLLIVIAIELASMPSYALVGFDRNRRTAAEASLKYVLFGAVTSGFMIYGVSLLFGMFGTLHLPTLVERLAAAEVGQVPGALLAVGLLALFAGVGFKISAVPFHFWCPDAFEGASLPVATWLSVASKAAGIVLLLRIVSIFAEPESAAYRANVLPVIGYGVGFFAILTCTVANIAAYQQNNVRRLLAYSSIAHAGYMLCAGAVVLRVGGVQDAAVSAIAQYLLVYLFMNFGAFLTLGLVAADAGSEEMEAFTGLGWRDPATALGLSVCLFSLIGLPPLGGFVVKFWLIWALGGAAQVADPGLSAMLWVLVIAVVVNTVISLFYYVRIMRQMYLRGEEADAALRAPLPGKLAVQLCALVLLLTGTLLIPTLKRNGDAAAREMYTATDAGLPGVVLVERSQDD